MFKRYFFSFIFLVGLFFCLPVKADTNVLLNSSFEDTTMGNPDHWHMTTISGTSAISVFTSSTVAHTGANSIKCSQTIDGIGNGCLLYQNVTISTSTDYEYYPEFYTDNPNSEDFGFSNSLFFVTANCPNIPTIESGCKIYNWDTQAFDDFSSFGFITVQGHGYNNYLIHTCGPTSYCYENFKPAIYRLKSNLYSDIQVSQMIIPLKSSINVYLDDFGFWQTTSTPISTSTINQYYDMPFTNVLLMILVAIALFEMLRRLFMFLKKR